MQKCRALAKVESIAIPFSPHGFWNEVWKTLKNYDTDTSKSVSTRQRILWAAQDCQEPPMRNASVYNSSRHTTPTYLTQPIRTRLLPRFIGLSQPLQINGVTVTNLRMIYIVGHHFHIYNPPGSGSVPTVAFAAVPAMHCCAVPSNAMSSCCFFRVISRVDLIYWLFNRDSYNKI